MTKYPGHAVLQVGVPELESWIVARTKFYDPRFLSRDERFRHAHITVLAPLQEWDTDAIAELAATTDQFDYLLREIAVFPNGCIHLVPEPDEPFRELTRRAWLAHPAVVPNGAPFPTPHLTLDLEGTAVTAASTRRLLGETIPAQGRARSLELVWYKAGNCHLLQQWPLNSVETPTTVTN